MPITLRPPDALRAAGRAGILATGLLLALPSAALAACPAPPAAPRDLDLPRFYGDAAGSVVDPAAKASHAAAVSPLTEFVREVARQADRSARAGSPAKRQEAGACALQWIAAWALQGALEGRMATPQAEHQRKWDLAGIALAYLKVKDLAAAEQRAAIEPWLVRLADAARAYFDAPGRKRNNHWYWLGLAQAATALAADSERHWLAARASFADAARDIGPDGTLAMELARGARALHYHAFAAMPLVVLAEIALRRGEDWYATESGALHRLVDITARGLADPALFDRLAGTPQERPTSPGAGWPALYGARFPGRAGAPMPAAPAAHRWLGGDVAALTAILDAKAAAAAAR